MVAKNKYKKRQTKSKITVGNKRMRVKKTAKKKTAMKRKPRTKLAKKKAAQKRVSVKKKAVGKKTIAKTVSVVKKQVREKRKSVDTVAFLPEEPLMRSGRQSGDLQGLSSVQGADSESVDELLEEGNAFEADVVTGVEDAGNADEKDVRTHEVAQDDVPGEYLDKE